MGLPGVTLGAQTRFRMFSVSIRGRATKVVIGKTDCFENKICNR